jgi:glycosyltransferase involved in cell wall biosynthesis
VVSTPAGINGLDLAPEQEVIVTNSPAEMARKIEALNADPAARQILETRAREAALRYDWSAIAAEQSRLYQTLMPTRVK